MKKLLPVLLCAAMLLCLLPLEARAAAAAWDVTFDISWYDPAQTEYTIDTPAKLAGLAALVNGMADPAAKAIVGDRSYLVSKKVDNVMLVGAGGGNVFDTVYTGGVDFAYKTIYLTADLDMGGRKAADGSWTGPNWTPIGGKFPMKPAEAAGDCMTLDTRFNGVLDGQGHTIYNLTISSLGADRAETVDGNDKTYDTALTGFFSVLSGASVRDLSLRGVNIAVETPENVFAGTLAGFASPETVLENISVFDARIALTETCQREPIDEHDRCIAGIGGLVGFGGGTYTNCSADSTLVFSDESIASLRCEEFLGGILSCGNATLTGCTAAIDGYAACRGYAHNGGLVGMFYQYDKTVDISTISGCAVTGKITFFEDNADRRAYCEAFAGELLTWTNITECTADFQRNEIYDYSAAVKPEKCAEPTYTDTVVTGNCDTFGYTEHTCAVCGYSYRDTFTPPQHTPGEWTETKAPTETEDGEETLRCALCGAEMEKRAVPKHVSGNWMTVTAPTYDREGLRQRFCADCGVLLGEDSLFTVDASALREILKA